MRPDCASLVWGGGGRVPAALFAARDTMWGGGGSKHAATLTLSTKAKEELRARPVAPEFQRNCLSRWTFSWVSPLMKRGNEAALQLKVR